MLPAALLTYRLQGDTITPSFLGEADHPWLRALIDERERFVGKPRDELSARSKEPLPIAAPSRKRALAARVLETLAARRPRPEVASPKIRSLVFKAAAAEVSRERVLHEVAAQLGMTAGAVEAALFADLPERQAVPPLARPVAPVDLAARANLALARGLLARADHIRLEIEGNALPVVRRAKLRGLIVNVTMTEGRATLDVSGPLSLFHHTRVYGRALGDLLPLLCWCNRFELDAVCVLPDLKAKLRLRTGDPIFPSDEPVRFDSRLEEQFARQMRQAAPDWDVVRDPQPLTAGSTLTFPDFGLVHREDQDRRWLLEIVGFWTPGYLARKLESYRLARVDNLILCIDERRRCEDGDLPAGAHVVWYKRRIDPRAVLAVISQEIAGARTVIVSDPPATAPSTNPPRRDRDRLLDAIRGVAARSPYGNAFLPLVERLLGREIDLGELLELCRDGSVARNRPTADIAIRPLHPPRKPLPVSGESVDGNLANAINLARRGPGPPLYHMVRERFDWLGLDGEDRLHPVVAELARQQRLVISSVRGRSTIDTHPAAKTTDAGAPSAQASRHRPDSAG